MIIEFGANLFKSGCLGFWGVTKMVLEPGFERDLRDFKNKMFISNVFRKDVIESKMFYKDLEISSNLLKNS